MSATETAATRAAPGAVEHTFRYRGREVSRVEAFSDAAFGFALTLLVITLELPRSADALLQNLRGWPAFAACFALLVQIWFKHHMFFRRYGLQSGPIIALNAGLLFVVLLYVYPLRFMAWILLGSPSDPARRAALQSNSVESVRELFLAYGIGFTAIFTLFGALYFCAWQSRRALELSLYEQAQTWRLMHTQFLVAAVGGLSIGLTLFLSPQKLAWAGFVYALVGVVEFCCGLWRGAPVGKSRSASGG